MYVCVPQKLTGDLYQFLLIVWGNDIGEVVDKSDWFGEVLYMGCEVEGISYRQGRAGDDPALSIDEIIPI